MNHFFNEPRAIYDEIIKHGLAKQCVLMSHISDFEQEPVPFHFDGFLIQVYVKNSSTRTYFKTALQVHVGIEMLYFQIKFS